MRILRMPLPGRTSGEAAVRAGVEDGETPLRPATHPQAIAVLDPLLYQDMRWCADCAGEQIFVEVFECAAGRVGYCLGCGEEKLVAFEREVA